MISVLEVIILEHIHAKRNIYTKGKGASNISIKKLAISKFKSSCLSCILDVTMPFVMDKPKSKKGASVSEEFTLFNCNSVGYLTYHVLEIRNINIKQSRRTASIYLEIELNA